MTATVATPPATTRQAGPSQRRRWFGSAIRLILLLGFLCLVLIPVYVLIVTSFKARGEISAADAWSLPSEWTTDGWQTAWDRLRGPLWRSIQLAVPGAIVSSVLGSMNGFVLSRWRFPYSNLVFVLILFGMFIPYQAVMLPLIELVIEDANIENGIPALLVTHIVYGIPICTLIFRNYYETIPNDLVEAARVDGAGMLQTYARIILPLSAPAFVVTLIWQFTSIWNDFLFALFMSSENNGPVTLALNNLAGGQLSNYQASMAAALIASIPTLLVYIILGRYFLRGLMAGSLKG
ncbi:MAG: carbohydrate ABC transporter permease [Nocardioidaceae bacterium]